ncbi:uncharacterized protein LOC18013713 isoform X3 [Eutrema salsugineum]|uniref:uncharacterized protein LOC18013713 isoform X3 n=1 Tax=Eutrema salsugineum TaxID=72664 RepID=UPI000CECF83F|nr:uncharacterized protein LOC18013713 isoform X3 [Eutrema salsugineum]
MFHDFHEEVIATASIPNPPVFVSRHSHFSKKVLTNGIEVKLQRNALSVIEAPTGNEEDNDIEVEHTQWNPSDITMEDTLQPHKSKQRGHRSVRLSHKTMCRALSCDSHLKSLSLAPRRDLKVDLSKLDMPALLRYRRHFNLLLRGDVGLLVTDMAMEEVESLFSFVLGSDRWGLG